MNKLCVALMELAPNAQWVLEGDDLAGLTWLDSKIKKPSDEEIIIKLSTIE